MLSAAMTDVDIVWALLCSPTEKAWKPLMPGSCIDLLSFVWGQAIPSIFLDICLLLLPLRPLWKLQMPISNKLALTGIFGVALFAIACSIIRLAIVISHFGHDVTYQWVPGILWSVAELDVCFICSCLPVMKPMFVCLSNRRQTACSSSLVEQGSTYLEHNRG
ncbi:hypothetical protein EV356DRAFT_130913 [Viridothelium virens]|uniref:Rhodopsin domain-containing protein n=1 Tax=Viridothelium virens TaxID=1048519 RepID=A0A6A6HAT5_VIRVR|nr:hypothetical protein EV356DRAFT_130913 [Viridothelium virens]